MSAFVVSAACMDRCVNAICAETKWGGHLVRMFGDVFTDAPDARTRIGRALFAMNVEAVMQRYYDCRDNPDDMPGPCDDDGKSLALKLRDNFRSDRVPPLTRAHWCQALKSLHCLQYQCSEGNVPETDLFDELSRVIGKVAGVIAEMLPEYEAAEWG